MTVALSRLSDGWREGLRQSVTFVAIGGGAALAFVVLSAVLIGMRTGLADWLASTLVHLCLIGPVYALHRRYAFRSARRHGVALPRYVATQGVSLLLTAVLSFAAYTGLDLPPLLAAPLIVAATSATSLVLSRFWVFGAAA